MNDLMSLAENDPLMIENQKRMIDREGSAVFPIKDKLKKELRELKNGSIGNLRINLSNIRSEKENEYRLSKEDLLIELKQKISKANILFSKTAKKIMLRKMKHDDKVRDLNERVNGENRNDSIDFFKKLDALSKLYTGVYQEKFSYDFPLKQFRGKEEVIVKKEKIVLDYEKYNRLKESETAFNIVFSQDGFEDMIRREFDEQWGENFSLCEKKIEKLESQFDEALLFGDLEVVKRIYFDLKKAEGFLDELRNMKLTKKEVTL